ncbi:MAG: ATP-binding protein, partial [Gammaproteobacteria bacterium]|nr:ATP-binding protein [Gammaproteobacteria bacterium]
SMSSHIQRLLKVQREMINAISHELRTPIARLRFGLEVMKDEVDDNVAKTIEALEGDVEELNTLVDEVLTYGKLEAGSLALNFKEISISQLVGDILQHNHLLLQHLSVEVNIDETDLVLADEHHLSRALQNLILNASKYAAGKIVITFSHDEERWQLDIEDDGPGIAFEDRDKVFIPFQRLDNSRTRASGGYGLGLAIVQRIAFWHGGAVLIDASESGGAKFSLIWSRNQHQNSLS